VSGEDRAAAWYLERGYEVLGRNWRCREGELDLIARRGGTMVFCEVKTRSGTRFGAPAEAVIPSKQARIRRLAARWLQEHRAGLRGRPMLLRFDVAAILDGRIDVLEGAF
jgi:putative endonuclease